MHLEGVRPNGKGHVAICPHPAHTTRKRSLYITEAGELILLKCHRCHDTPGILAAIGLEMADLFPERIRDPSPESRRRAREFTRLHQVEGAAEAIAFEALIVVIAASRLRTDVPLTSFDFERLHRAESLIQQSRMALQR
jgi:hypothetical protein